MISQRWLGAWNSPHSRNDCDSWAGTPHIWAQLVLEPSDADCTEVQLKCWLTVAFFCAEKNICCFSRIQKIDVWHVSFKHHDRCQRSSRRSASNVHRILYRLMESHRILLLPARISTVKQPSCSSAPLGCQSAPRQSADVLSLKWVVGRMFQYNRSWTWSRWVVLFFFLSQPFLDLYSLPWSLLTARFNLALGRCSFL